MIKRNMYTRGGLGWWKRDGRAARRILYTFQLSLNPSETGGVSQVEQKTKTNKQSHESWSAQFCGMGCALAVAESQ